MSNVPEKDLATNERLIPECEKTSTDEVTPLLIDTATQRTSQALTLVCANLPWLSPLAYSIQLIVDQRIPIAAVTATGRVLVNPIVFSKISMAEASYVLAHELLHLALDSFSRVSHFDDHKIVNWAHDYIINDLLYNELGVEPPLGGLFRFGASSESLEKIVSDVTKNLRNEPKACWAFSSNGKEKQSRSENSSETSMSVALREAGLISTATKATQSSPASKDCAETDMIPIELERQLFPSDNLGNAEMDRSIEKIGAAVGKCLALKRITNQFGDLRLRGNSPGRMEQYVEAIRRRYSTPWQTALQRWMEMIAPTQRSWSRPSRRGADRTDCVLPGRLREGWTLHVVIDTSGSMTDEIPDVLGAIAEFCESALVTEVHILQCDTEVNVNAWIPVEELENFRIIGYGGSDLSPAMNLLAEDHGVTAMVVITDGMIGFPSDEPPCKVLWVSTSEHDFHPPYGELVLLSKM